jgi:hypothetical protein
LLRWLPFDGKNQGMSQVYSKASILVGIILLAGCAAGGADPAPVFVVQEAQEVVVEYTGPAAPCGMVLNPDEEIRSLVETSAQRLEAATGCPITFGPSGIPVHAWSYVFMDWEESRVYDYDPQLDRDQVCGMTVSGFDNAGQPHANDIYISTKEPRCDLADTITHELGHVWGPPGSHAEQGVFAEGTSGLKTPEISENSLTWLCSRLECQAFKPE